MANPLNTSTVRSAISCVTGRPSTLPVTVGKAPLGHAASRPFRWGRTTNPLPIKDHRHPAFPHQARTSGRSARRSIASRSSSRSAKRR